MTSSRFALRAGVLLLWLSVPLLCIVGCSQEPPPKPNIVLVSIDTLRADHLTPYRHRRNTSPFLDELARQSVLFEDAVSQSGTTPQSLSSMMTGLFPYADGILTENEQFVFLKRGNTTLAAVLAKAGYNSHAITSSVQSATVTGIDLGFSTFDGITVEKRSGRRRTAEQMTDLAGDWLARERAGGRPFFLWLHYIDPHYPYSPPENYEGRWAEEALTEEGEVRTYVFDPKRSRDYPLSDRELRDIELNYDREIAYTDDALRILFEEKLAPFLDDSLVIFTADHGESLGEHRIITHNELYHSILRVPLLIRLPGGEQGGRVVDQPVMLVDIVPTVLELLGLPRDPGLRGVSLLGVMRGEGDLARRPRLAEYPVRTAIYSDPFKLIHREAGSELYDLSSDPDELNDLSVADTDRVAALMQQTAALRASGTAEPPSDAGPLPEVTPEMVDELKALGYVDG